MRLPRLLLIGLLASTGSPALAQAPVYEPKPGKILYPAWAKPTDTLINEQKNDAALATLRKLPAKYQSHYVFHVLAADIWDGKYQETTVKAEEIKYLKWELASLQKARALAVKARASQVLPEIEAEIAAVSAALKTTPAGAGASRTTP